MKGVNLSKEECQGERIGLRQRYLFMSNRRISSDSELGLDRQVDESVLPVLLAKGFLIKSRLVNAAQNNRQKHAN